LQREARKCRVADRTITVCRCDRDRLVAGGLAEDRVVYVPNGIPAKPAEHRPPIEGPIRLGFLGRLEAEKNPLMLAAVGAALERRMPEGWSVAIAGEGPMRAPLARAFQERGLTARVSWLGETDGPAPLLARADLLCVPSHREGQPLGVLEAMQAGVVPVARRIASLEELLDGDPAAGLLLPADPEAWASEIEDLARSAERMDVMIKEGRRRIDRDHRLEAMVERVEGLYRDCFASAASR
jgi:glycosyltransferase involved in cell wall biosynthesis